MDNEPCPQDRKPMEFLGYATYFDGRYSIWKCACGVEVAKKEEV